MLSPAAVKSGVSFSPPRFLPSHLWSHRGTKTAQDLHQAGNEIRHSCALPGSLGAILSMRQELGKKTLPLQKKMKG